MNRIATMLMICILMMASSCKYIESHNPFTKKERARELAIQKQIDSIRIADSIIKANLAIKQKAIEDSIASINQAIVKVNDEGLKFHIIIGSFKNPEYATSYADFYLRRGVATEVLDKANSSFKLVSASSYKTLHEASVAIKAVRDTILTESWVYKSE
ncbi:MAG TPA: hypothetical protein PLP69_05935 [Bacteroidales bacterium]|nr:hypothetical protein [Bacteroidales bacterium]